MKIFEALNGDEIIGFIATRSGVLRSIIINGETLHETHEDVGFKSPFAQPMRFVLKVNKMISVRRLDFVELLTEPESQAVIWTDDIYCVIHDMHQVGAGEYVIDHFDPWRPLIELHDRRTVVGDSVASEANPWGEAS